MVENILKNTAICVLRVKDRVVVRKIDDFKVNKRVSKNTSINVKDTEVLGFDIELST